MLGNLSISTCCDYASWGVQHAIRLLECRCHSVYHAIVCHPSDWPSCVARPSLTLFIPLASFSSGSHPFDYEPAIYASSDWVSHIRESRSLANSQFSKSYLHIEGRLKARIVECKPIFQPYLWADLPDAKILVDSLLVRNHLLRGTAVSALQSRWISLELEELEALYERRINATLGIVA